MNTYFRSTISYLTDKKLFCMKCPKPFPRWQHIFRITDPDSIYIWYIGLFLVFFMTAVFYLYAEFESPRVRKFDFFTICTYVLGALMVFSMPYTKHIENSMTKLFIAFALICATTATSVFQSVFYNILLKSRYPSKMDSISDTMNANLKFLSTTYLAVTNQYKINIYISIKYSFLLIYSNN